MQRDVEMLIRPVGKSGGFIGALWQRLDGKGGAAYHTLRISGSRHYINDPLSPRLIWYSLAWHGHFSSEFPVTFGCTPAMVPALETGYIA